MTSLPDRQKLIEVVENFHKEGAPRSKVCKELGLSLRTLQRWKSSRYKDGDGRPLAIREPPANKLTDEEQSKVLEICHSREFGHLPPSQIVPRLADKGEYICSESSFYRILKKQGELMHRGRNKRREKSRPQSTHCAKNPCEVWSWDITWLPGPAKGVFFYLYLIMDVYSRKIVGWEVYEEESSEHARDLIHKTLLKEGCIGSPLVIHSDNGSPMKGATLLELLHKLEIEPSYSRPRVSNDNAYSESLFRTIKYSPEYPSRGFMDISLSRDWVLKFVRLYNQESRHSSIKFLTPEERHTGKDEDILSKRDEVYCQARLRHPERWSGNTRNWEPIKEVWLNPEQEAGKLQTVEQVA